MVMTMMMESQMALPDMLNSLPYKEEEEVS